jgi:hypothetical protein
VNQAEPGRVIHIDTGVLGSRDLEAILAFATEMIQAITDAYTSNGVTYIVSNGEVVASVNPPEAGERYEHAAEVMVEARQHVAAVPVRAERRRRFRVWSPFEGVF